MFGILITPFWLAISVIYLGLGVFHCRLSKRVRVDIEFPGKDNILGVGNLAEFEENEYRKTAYLNKQTLRFAAGGFFVAFIISFYQSVSNNQWQMALDSAQLIAIGATAIVAVLIAVLLAEYLTYKWFIQITIPWMWYDEKKGVTYDLVIKPSWNAAVDVDDEHALVDRVYFEVRAHIKKYREDRLGEGVTIKEVSGELTVSNDAGAKLLERIYESRRKGERHNITLDGRFEDKDTHKHAWWQLNDMILTPFEKSSKVFSFSASAHKIH
jgi:hypothetical protein